MSVPELLDARGLLCPLPVIRTQDRVKELPPGTVLEVIATDRGTLHDIPAWCRVHGHEVLSIDAQPPSISSTDTAAKMADPGDEIRIRLKVTG